MQEPKISVIIPTRARRDVLQKALLTATSQGYANLEILVSDNFSCDGTEEFVRSVTDSRVRYLNPGKRLSMAKNWEFAVSHVEDGWVTIMGDDDGLLPESMSAVARIIREAGVQAIRSNVCAYVWPSLLGKEFGRLAVPLRSGYEVRNSKQWLQKVLDGHAAYPQLPMLYYGGFVDVAVLKQIKKRTGTVYSSCVPDVYSAVSIASVIDTYAYCHEPLCINGASRHSTGTSQFSHDPTKEASPARMFAAEENIPFHEALPLCTDGSYPSSLQAMVYESYLQSAVLRAPPRANLHARMLTIILATSRRSDSRVEDWAKLFASRHGLDFEAINKRARLKKIGFTVSGSLRQFYEAINTFSIGSPAFPITDVYQASIAAGATRSIGVSRAKNIGRLAGRALQLSTGFSVGKRKDLICRAKDSAR